MYTALVIIRKGEEKDEINMSFGNDDLMTVLNAVEAMLKYAIGESVSVSILRK